MRRQVIAVTAALALMTLAAGCNRGGSGGGGGGGGQTIALSLSTLNNPYFVAMKRAAQKAAGKAGADLVVTDAQDDASTQLSDVQNLVTQQVDAILVNPVDTGAIVPAIKQANQAQIPVVGIDRGASGGDLGSVITSDNVKGGEIAARELIKLVGSGEVAELEGIPGTSAARDRGAGFDKVINSQSKVKVVASQTANFDRATALKVMQNLIQANPNIKGVFAQNDEMALGAIKALGSKAGNDIMVVGFDGEPDALVAVKKGTLNATVGQHPDQMTAMGVQDALKLIDGKKVQKKVELPVDLVTKKNVAQFSWHL